MGMILNTQCLNKKWTKINSKVPQINALCLRDIQGRVMRIFALLIFSYQYPTQDTKLRIIKYLLSE